MLAPLLSRQTLGKHTFKQLSRIAIQDFSALIPSKWLSRKWSILAQDGVLFLVLQVKLLQ